MKLTHVYICLLAVVLLGGCKKDKAKAPEQEEKPDTGNFVSEKALGDYTVSQLKAVASLGGYGSAAGMIIYDVRFVKIIYKTTYKGQPVNASGLLAIPKNTFSKLPVISAQHGTTFLASAAPSNFPSVSAFTGFELLAATGLIAVIPDYIGYGESKNVTHPYYDKLHSAAAVTDMLKAVTYYLKKEKVNFSEDLFLLGYSEGGYVSLAAQQAIEKTPIPGLSLRGVAAGAGGYDVNHMLNFIIRTPTYKDSAYLAMIMKAYNITYDWNRPYTDFFQQPYAGRILTWLDGTADGDEVNAQLSTNMAELFNPDFAAALSGNGEQTFKEAAANNSLTDWVPKTPLRLYHGTADQTVIYWNSEIAFNKFNAAGAADVKLIPIAGGTHQSSILPMITNALSWFDSLDK